VERTFKIAEMTKTSNKKSVKEIYKQRRDKFAVSLDQVTRKIRQVSMLRISVFLAGLLAIYFGTTISVWAVIVVALVFARKREDLQGFLHQPLHD
jgi:hypothetical protein